MSKFKVGERVLLSGAIDRHDHGCGRFRYGVIVEGDEPELVRLFVESAIIAAECDAIKTTDPIPMRIPCPECGELHIDEGEFATRVHHTHACQFCGCVWRPAVVATVGVRFLPGFKNETKGGG